MDKDEIAQDSLLVGQQGKFLGNLVNKARDYFIVDAKDKKFSWAAINFVNAKLGKNSGEQYAYFVERIEKFCKKWKPTSIVCLSPRFLRYFYPEKFSSYQAYGKYLGSYIEHKGLRVFPCVDLHHMLSAKTEQGVSGALTIIARVIANGICGRVQYGIDSEKIVEAEIKIVDTFEKFKILMKRLRKQKYIAVDTETNGLNKVKVKMLTIQFCYNLDEAYILPIYHKDSTFNAKEMAYILKDLKAFFEGDNQVEWFIYHNANFDLNVIRVNAEVDFYPNSLWDTVAGEYCFHPDTLVETEMGAVPIKDLVYKENAPKVLSYNIRTRETEYKSILSSSRHTTKQRMMKIKYSGGEVLITENHKVWSEDRKDYVEAKNLFPGESILILPQDNATSIPL
jgi:hypothetical protein